MQWLRDKDGNEFRLDDETWSHIQEFHPEIAEVGLIESVLVDPDWIIRSSWDAESILYCSGEPWFPEGTAAGADAPSA